MKAKKEASLSKITTRFVIKLVKWFLLLYIILGLGVIVNFGMAIEGVDDDALIGKELNKFMINFIISNIVAIILSVLLTTRKIKKKFVINQENSKKIFKNIMIVLIVMTFLIAGIHFAIQSIFIYSVTDNNNNIYDIEKAINAVEKYDSEGLIEMSELEAIGMEQLKSFLTKTKIFVCDSVMFLAMIPVTKIMIVKKEEQTENIQ